MDWESSLFPRRLLGDSSLSSCGCAGGWTGVGGAGARTCWSLTGAGGLGSDGGMVGSGMLVGIMLAAGARLPGVAGIMLVAWARRSGWM